MPVTKAPHRVDMTLAREYCPYHPSVVIKKKKLRKDKYIPCYGCLQVRGMIYFTQLGGHEIVTLVLM
jgi:hypothetical protein